MLTHKTCYRKFAGIKYVNGNLWGFDDLSEVDTVKTYQYAELFAVKLILINTALCDNTC